MATTFETFVWNYFIEKIGNEYGVAGLMGNLYAESGIIPNNLQNSYNTSLGMTDEEYTRLTDTYAYKNFYSDSAGYGIAQWTIRSRKLGLYNLWEWGVQQGIYTSISDISLQCDYLWQELQLDYSGVLSVLQTASSVKQASDIVLHNFENPADQSVSVEVYRASLGQGYYNTFKGTSGDLPEPEAKKKKKGFNWVLFNARRRMYGKR